MPTRKNSIGSASSRSIQRTLKDTRNPWGKSSARRQLIPQKNLQLQLMSISKTIKVWLSARTKPEIFSFMLTYLISLWLWGEASCISDVTTFGWRSDWSDIITAGHGRLRRWFAVTHLDILFKMGKQCDDHSFRAHRAMFKSGGQY